jgi:hypothetical protein
MKRAREPAQERIFTHPHHNRTKASQESTLSAASSSIRANPFPTSSFTFSLCSFLPGVIMRFVVSIRGFRINTLIASYEFLVHASFLSPFLRFGWA